MAIICPREEQRSSEGSLGLADCTSSWIMPPPLRKSPRHGGSAGRRRSVHSGWVVQAGWCVPSLGAVSQALSFGARAASPRKVPLAESLAQNDLVTSHGSHRLGSRGVIAHGGCWL